MAAGYARAAGSLGTKIPHGFATLSASAESRWQDGPRASRLEAALKGFHLRPPVTVAARVAVRAGWRLDPEDRFELDGENGLRGYRLHAVNGTRNVVLNLEARRIVIPDLLHVVSLGVAAFADAGFSSGPPDGTRRLGDFGVGLRIGLGRASRHDLLRLDLARSFHPDPLGRTGWLLSFSSGQAF
jgi:outer membrane protein assembly factor BamA